jgi:hypothetical protein
VDEIAAVWPDRDVDNHLGVAKVPDQQDALALADEMPLLEKPLRDQDQATRFAWRQGRYSYSGECAGERRCALAACAGAVPHGRSRSRELHPIDSILLSKSLIRVTE